MYSVLKQYFIWCKNNSYLDIQIYSYCITRKNYLSVLWNFPKNIFINMVTAWLHFYLHMSQRWYLYVKTYSSIDVLPYSLSPLHSYWHITQSCKQVFWYAHPDELNFKIQNTVTQRESLVIFFLWTELQNPEYLHSMGSFVLFPYELNDKSKIHQLRANKQYFPWWTTSKSRILLLEGIVSVSFWT